MDLEEECGVIGGGGREVRGGRKNNQNALCTWMKLSKDKFN